MEFSALPTGMYVLIGLSLLVGAIAHWKIKQFWVASVSAACATVILFLFASILQGGIPELLVFRAFIYFGVVAFVLAAVVGGIGRLVRRVSPSRA